MFHPAPHLDKCQPAENAETANLAVDLKQLLFDIEKQLEPFIQDEIDEHLYQHLDQINRPLVAQAKQILPQHRHLVNRLIQNNQGLFDVKQNRIVMIEINDMISTELAEAKKNAKKIEKEICQMKKEEKKSHAHSKDKLSYDHKFKQIKYLQDKKKALTDKVVDSEEDNFCFKKSILGSKTSLIPVKTETGKINLKIEQIQAKIDSYQAQCDDYFRQYDIIEVKLLHLQCKIARLEKKLSFANQRVDRLYLLKKNYQQNITELDQQLATLFLNQQVPRQELIEFRREHGGKLRFAGHNSGTEITNQSIEATINHFRSWSDNLKKINQAEFSRLYPEYPLSSIWQKNPSLNQFLTNFTEPKNGHKFSSHLQFADKLLVDRIKKVEELNQTIYDLISQLIPWNYHLKRQPQSKTYHKHDQEDLSKNYYLCLSHLSYLLTKNCHYINRHFENFSSYTFGHGHIIELFSTAILNESAIDSNNRKFITINAPDKVEGYKIDTVIAGSDSPFFEAEKATFQSIFPLQITNARPDSPLYLYKQSICHINGVSLFSVNHSANDLIKIFTSRGRRIKSKFIADFREQIKNQVPANEFFQKLVDQFPGV